MALGTSPDGDTAGDRTTVRVLVAGGRRLARDGIAALLSTDPDVEVVGSVAEALAARACVGRMAVDVVVAHVWLEDPGGGARLAIELRDERPEVGVVLLLGDGSDAAEVREVLDRGTAQRAILLMDQPRCARDLVHAVHEVADGGSVVHPGVVDLVLRAERTAADHLEGLTPREQQVLAAIAAGATNRAVAELLCLSDKAVEKHINQLYTKLGLPVDSRLHRRVAAALVAHGRFHGDAVPLRQEG